MSRRVFKVHGVKEGKNWGFILNAPLPFVPPPHLFMWQDGGEPKGLEVRFSNPGSVSK